MGKTDEKATNGEHRVTIIRRIVKIEKKRKYGFECHSTNDTR